MMHGTMKIKFINAKQAKNFFEYKNNKRKMYKINAAICYNKMCKLKGITPSYINIKINGNNKQTQRTKETAIRHRLNQEIRFLHNKKRHINLQLYKTHLTSANEWKNQWPLMELNTEDGLKHEMEKHYENLNKKLHKLITKQKRIIENNLHNTKNQFYNLTVNLTTIKFNQEEPTLLDHGMQHSIEIPLEKFWNDLIIQTDRAVRKFEPKLQEAYRTIAAKKLKQIKNSSHPYNNQAKRQTYILNNIKNKLKQGHAMIIKADKGKTTVIIDTTEHNNKTLESIHSNAIKTLTNNPTSKFQKRIKDTLKLRHLIINKTQIKYLTQNKPQAPILKAQIKLHKMGNPIRPAVNSINAPNYKLAKFLTKNLKAYIQLPYQYKVKNSTNLAHYLKQLKLYEKHNL